MKSEILAMLKQSGSEYISGQEISRKFGVTRAAVWKTIKQLQSEGYGIESATNNGYRLLSCPDILTYDEIRPYLKTDFIGRKIIHYDSIGSTNNEARELAEAGEPEGTVVISERQTGGRGRSGKKWISQDYKGILMSVILRPDMDLAVVPLVTLIGCAAAGMAIEKLTDNVRLKWPNDVFLNGRKIGGILTETAGEIDKVDYIVLGIGINVNQSEREWPGPLNVTPTSLKIEMKKEISRQKLVSDILNEFEKQYKKFKEQNAADETLEYCRAHSSLTGKNILLKRNGRQTKAQVMDISSNGQLAVRYPNGMSENVSSADISVSDSIL